MRSITNLVWPITPFGAGQRPFGKPRPMLAAVTIGWAGYVQRPTWACAVYLTTDSTRTIVLDGQELNFGFEVLLREPKDEPARMAGRLDEILVTCRRQAKILAGYNFAPDLARLTGFAGERRLAGVDAVRQQWTDRATKGRGTARMIDAAHDLVQPIDTTLARLCAGAVDGPYARRAITRTLAVALVAARATGKYEWASPLDVDQFVSAAAWDLFEDTPRSGLVTTQLQDSRTTIAEERV